MTLVVAQPQVNRTITMTVGVNREGTKKSVANMVQLKE